MVEGCSVNPSTLYVFEYRCSSRNVMLDLAHVIPFHIQIFILRIQNQYLTRGETVECFFQSRLARLHFNPLITRA